MIGRWDSPSTFNFLEPPWLLPTGLEHDTKPSSVLDDALAPFILVFTPANWSYKNDKITVFPRNC